MTKSVELQPNSTEFNRLLNLWQQNQDGLYLTEASSLRQSSSTVSLRTPCAMPTPTSSRTVTSRAPSS